MKKVELFRLVEQDSSLKELYEKHKLFGRECVKRAFYHSATTLFTNECENLSGCESYYI